MDSRICFESFFSEQEILDDQLRMILCCCHPIISPDSQIAPAIKILCGWWVCRKVNRQSKRQVQNRIKRDELHTFKILPKRWIVERTFSWIDTNRRNSKNYERLNNTSVSII